MASLNNYWLLSTNSNNNIPTRLQFKIIINPIAPTQIEIKPTRGHRQRYNIDSTSPLVVARTNSIISNVHQDKTASCIALTP